jgi:tripartite-type tricarboxylate transporter receptor subunit TctC
MRMLRMAVVLCAGMGSAPALAADAWPSRPVKLVVPFSAAGTADLLARLVADRLGPVLGQPVVVEHRPGAGGIVGQEQVARASPDGYTLVVSSLGSFIISPVFTPVPFDPFRTSPTSPISAASRSLCSPTRICRSVRFPTL